jgi:SAM-dependent methyltransferase
MGGTQQDAVEIVVPTEVVETAAQSLGVFFEAICKVDRHANARDFLDLSKAYKRAMVLQCYTSIENRKLLEVGSGFGTNLAVWLKHFHVDARGVEPGSEGFNHGYLASRKLLEANGLDPERVMNASGEALPFADGSFDIVYSANVLEHTTDPEQVLREALRVLRPGGLLHMEMPNYLSFFEGHYMVVQPPILWRPMLWWWVKLVIRRDPAFVNTLQTKVNPVWCRQAVARLSREYPLTLVSLGEELFLKRLCQPFEFETKMAANEIGGLIGLVQRLNWGNWIGHLMVALRVYYPIYLTVRKSGRA